MRILVTGHNGYIGSVLAPMLVAAGHEVTGIDTFYYEDCTYGPDDTVDVQAIRKDVRDVEDSDVAGFDAIVHLAALSNDPLGDLRAENTYEINHRAGVRLARLAKEAGVPRFVFSSSCSLYGASPGEELLEEDAPFNPVTPYGESKVRSEYDLTKMADDTFSPTFLRNATAYGAAPRLRGDVVVNNLVGYAVTTGEVRLMSDGSQWRPLVHVVDIARACMAVLDAPRDLVHSAAFNVCSTTESYRIRDVADAIAAIVPGARVTVAGGATADLRNYRVRGDAIAERLGFVTEWTVERGVHELLHLFDRHGLTLEQLTGPRLQRVARIKELLSGGALDDRLRWRAVTPSRA